MEEHCLSFGGNLLLRSGRSQRAASGSEEPVGLRIRVRHLKFLAFTAPYDALLTDAQEVASLRGESSNQLLETLEEWNDYLERQCARTATTAAIVFARRCRVSKGFPGSSRPPRASLSLGSGSLVQNIVYRGDDFIAHRFSI
jgi:hypothetical protein